jgi:hypothetical protein
VRLTVLAFVYVLANVGVTYMFVFGYKGRTYQDPKARGVDIKEVEFKNDRNQRPAGHRAHARPPLEPRPDVRADRRSLPAVPLRRAGLRFPRLG